jgi:hypothetical protein
VPIARCMRPRRPGATVWWTTASSRSRPEGPRYRRQCPVPRARGTASTVHVDKRGDKRPLRPRAPYGRLAATGDGDFPASAPVPRRHGATVVEPRRRSPALNRTARSPWRARAAHAVSPPVPAPCALRPPRRRSPACVARAGPPWRKPVAGDRPSGTERAGCGSMRRPAPSGPAPAPARPRPRQRAGAGRLGQAHPLAPVMRRIPGITPWPGVMTSRPLAQPSTAGHRRLRTPDRRHFACSPAAPAGRSDHLPAAAASATATRRRERVRAQETRRHAR